MRRFSPLFVAVLCLFAASCGDDAGTDVDTSSNPPNCEGPKCDGITDKFKDAFSDMRDVDLSDLTVLGAGLATEELNGQLKDVPYSQLELGSTALYGAQEEVFGETVVHDLTSLRTGLTDRLGEEAFATQVVDTRARFAEQNDVVWGESYFKIGPDLGHNWGFDSGDVVGSVGFTANATVETVVIAPYSDAFEAVVDAPLASIAETRGWILPRSVEDISSMAPGESLAMTADGALGMNLGAGVPFLIGTVADIVTLHARLSFAARVALAGKLDVQLVRGEGDTAWIDVGVRQQSLRHFSVALTTGFGVEGLPEVNLDLGPVDLDVDDLAEKALRKELDRRLTPELSASTTRSSLRLTVARFRFDLAAAGDEAFEQSIAQAMRGDIRLAQALANRPDTGVAQELDLQKDARSEGNYIGFRFLGMEFYRANNFDTGTIQIEANGENQTLLFSELEQKSGLFFTDRDFRWRKVVSITTVDGVTVDTQVNSRLTLREKDKFLTRDQMLDHVDAMSSYFIGHGPLFNDVGVQTDALAEFVDTTCGRLDSNATFSERQEFRDCLDSIPTMPEVQMAEAEIQSTIDMLVTGDVRGEFASGQTSASEYAAELLAFKLVLSKLNDRPDVALDGPEGQMVTQIRFSDSALHAMMQGRRAEDFRQSLENSLRVMANRRIADTERRQRLIDEYIDDRSSRLDEMAIIFLEGAARFSEYEDISASVLDGQELGDGYAMVIIDEDDQEKIDMGTIAEHKGRVMEELMPRLVDRADDGILRDLDEPGAFVVGYALLDMVEPSQIELLTSFTFVDEDAPEDVQLYSRGDAPFIEAGQFNLESLLAAE